MIVDPIIILMVILIVGYSDSVNYNNNTAQRDHPVTRDTAVSSQVFTPNKVTRGNFDRWGTLRPFSFQHFPLM